MATQPEFNFAISKALRNKKEYMGNWQLASRFRNLDSLLNDSFNRDMIIGHALPLALENYHPASYVVLDDRLGSKHHRDELQVYSGYLRGIEDAIKTNTHSPNEIVEYLTNEVSALVTKIENNSLRKQESEIFTKLFIESSFKEKNNPSNYLRTKGSKLFATIIDNGVLSGNRLVTYNNYDALINSK